MPDVTNVQQKTTRGFEITKLFLGDFTLEVESITAPGRWDAVLRQFTGIGGSAWISFQCATAPPVMLQFPDEWPGLVRLRQSVEVVARVVHQQTEISYADAQRIQPSIRIGESLHVDLPAHQSDVQRLLQGTEGMFAGFEGGKKGDILVEFQDLTVRPVPKRPLAGEVVAGSAGYFEKVHVPKTLRLVVDGFTLIIQSLILRVDGATAVVAVELPGKLASGDDCGPAMLCLGAVRISPSCDLYVEAPDAEFGPWVLGDTGLMIEGKGYTFDLSDTQSAAGMASAWRGLLLHSGSATGEALHPEPSNTAYLRGHYEFKRAILTKSGLDVRLDLAHSHSFRTLNPLGYRVAISRGFLNLTDSAITGGEFGPGNVDLPRLTVCKNVPGDGVSAPFLKLIVQDDLDLGGLVETGAGLHLSWGELTRVGREQVVWTVEARQAFFYLPCQPQPSFCADTGTGFLDFWLPSPVDAGLNQLEAFGMAGLALRDLHNLNVFSADRPTGSPPVQFNNLAGWLRIGVEGIDGELQTETGVDSVELGDPAHAGYVAHTPFRASLKTRDKMMLIGQHISSAVYDSGLDGTIGIQDPCKIDALEFRDMEFTSTARLAGGNVILPTAGVTLDYWRLLLVPTGAPNEAGVISVRTGRIVFTAAGISELRHFAKPFGLTWGEMLADGNLGELFFDHNNYGQRFDGFPYTPHHIRLSLYVALATDGYLATCGTAHFNLFGAHFLNIHDARNDAITVAPNFGRLVTTPKTGDASCAATDLHLAATWYDQTENPLAAFDFPDANMKYRAALQDGFSGGGTCEVGSFKSGPLDAFVELSAQAIDIRMSSNQQQDIDIGLFARLGALGQLAGCARIEGALLGSMSFYGLLEECVGTASGILAPKAGCVTEVNITTTPNSLDFSLAGDVLLQVAATAIDLSASVHLLHDYARGSAEGELIGRIDCNSVLGGLEGEGQVTWYAGPGMQYLQGRMKVYVCGWVGDGGMEGGFFIGHQVPKELAWVLHTGSEHFGVSDDILPSHLTGLFGYGMLSLSVNWYIFGGGAELYAGMGAFAEIPAGQQGVWPADSSNGTGVGLPYVLGSCGIYVHGEILGGLVSASAWGNLSLRGPVPIYFEGRFGLEGCVAWVICASIEVTAGINSHGFYLD